MASRLITDCRQELQEVLEYGFSKWKETYPNRPQPFLTCTQRPDLEQDYLYEQGRTRNGRVITNAQAGESSHNTVPASGADIAFKDIAGNLDWNTLLFKNFYLIIKDKYPDIVWGGNFQSLKDNPHFELIDWKEFRDKSKTV